MTNKKRILTPEEHARLLAAGSKMLGIKPLVKTDLTSFIEEAQSRINKIRKDTEAAYNAMLQAGTAGLDSNHKLLKADSQQKFLEAFMDYNQDELLTLLSIYFTQDLMKRVSGITS